MVVPVFKLFTLALKQVIKPVSKNLYVFAQDHPRPGPSAPPPYHRPSLSQFAPP